MMSLVTWKNHLRGRKHELGLLVVAHEEGDTGALRFYIELGADSSRLLDELTLALYLFLFVLLPTNCDRSSRAYRLF